jgi:DNA-binding HxlR family transcriptional regulator
MRTRRSFMRNKPKLKRNGRSSRKEQPGSSRELLVRLSAKWTMSVLAELANVPERCMRFSELKSRLEGVSQRMLAATLRALERDGLIHRRSRRDRPHRVEYMLTPLGSSMLLALKGFISFTMAHWPKVAASRRVYDKRQCQARCREARRPSHRHLAARGATQGGHGSSSQRSPRLSRGVHSGIIS